MLEGYKDNDYLICEDVSEEYPTGEHHEGPLEPEITLHALIGWTVPKTIQIVAKIGAQDVILLIDSRSIHNFISECMANLLRLLVVITESFMV